MSLDKPETCRGWRNILSYKLRIKLVFLYTIISRCTVNETLKVWICGNKMPTRCNRWFLLQILLLAQHVSGTIMPIIRSSRVLYRWLLLVVFGALVWSCRYGVELRVMCPAVKQQPANRMVAACGIWCFGFQVVGMVWSWGLCVRHDFMTTAQDDGKVVSLTPHLPLPRGRPSTHCTGGWVGPGAGLDRCGKSRLTGIRSPDHPARSVVPITTELSRLHRVMLKAQINFSFIPLCFSRHSESYC